MTEFVTFLKTMLNLTAPDSTFDRIVTAAVAAGKIVTIVIVIASKASELISAFTAAAK